MSQQIIDALHREGCSTAELADWLGLGLRAVQKRLQEDNWKASELRLLSERLQYRFDVNANNVFAEAPAPYHGASSTTGGQSIRLQIDLEQRRIPPYRLSEFLERYEALVQEFAEQS